jgi:S-adenosylmethionine synthetase
MEKSNQIALPYGHILFTSESVSAGHPDKLCDFISDTILDACLEQDPNSKVACESCVKNNMCMVFGEINSKADINYEKLVRTAIKEVGYDSVEKGMDYKTATIIIQMDNQSSEIFEALHTETLKPEDVGAGDQGLMIGYATDETEQLMPLTHMFSSQLCQRLTECRNKNILNFLGPDSKSQVTV